jgi:integrase
MTRKSLTDRGIRALKPRAARYSYPDPQLASHYVRVTPSGAKSFCCVARDPSGKQVWTTIGDCEMPIEEARTRAREMLRRVRDGLPAVEPRGESFAEVAGNWIKRHAEAKRLRSLKNITRLLRVHVLPRWSDRSFLSIRRSDVAALLDRIEDRHGARQADLVLTVVRSIMNWQAARTDDYRPPVIRGMRRQNPKEHARDRILTDDEIRAVWKQAEGNGAFGAIIRLALLTGQRRTKVAAMAWSDLKIYENTGIISWTVPQKPREKPTGGELVLPKVAADIIHAQPRIRDHAHVFPARRRTGHAVGFSEAKRDFDAKLTDVAAWNLHDLRRTARSLMSRAGVPSEHAERVLGHAIAGVEGIYDRHAYRDEKADALARLATLIQSIVHPHSGDVVPLRRKARVAHAK